MDVGATGREWRGNLGQELALLVGVGGSLWVVVEWRGEHGLTLWFEKCDERTWRFSAQWWKVGSRVRVRGSFLGRDATALM